MAVRQIRSSANNSYRELKRIVASARERRKDGVTLLEGARLVASYIESCGRPLRLLCSESYWQEREGALPGPFSGDVTVLRDGLFRSLSGVRSPTGVMALIAIPESAPAGKGGTAVMLDGIQDPGNLGTILRTAAAAGASRVCLSPTSADPWSPKALRAGMGAHFAIGVQPVDDLLAAARAHHGRIIALDHRAKLTVFEADLSGELVLLVGSEGQGIGRELSEAADLLVSIPMPGWHEPLNAATAAAVCLFEALRQKMAARERSFRPPADPES